MNSLQSELQPELRLRQVKHHSRRCLDELNVRPSLFWRLGYIEHALFIQNLENPSVNLDSCVNSASGILGDLVEIGRAGSSSASQDRLDVCSAHVQELVEQYLINQQPLLVRTLLKMISSLSLARLDDFAKRFPKKKYRNVLSQIIIDAGDRRIEHLIAKDLIGAQLTLLRAWIDVGFNVAIYIASWLLSFPLGRKLLQYLLDLSDEEDNTVE